jgi:hypothetical protein
MGEVRFALVSNRASRAGRKRSDGALAAGGALEAPVWRLTGRRPRSPAAGSGRCSTSRGPALGRRPPKTPLPLR